MQRINIKEEKDVGCRARKNQLTVLEQRSVSCEVQIQYKSHLERFKSFCVGEGIIWPPVDNCDEVLADFMDIEFLEGHSAAQGEKVLAAVEFWLTGTKGRLVRSRRALKGWRKEMPAGSRLPLPRIIAYGMAMIMLAKNQRLEALKLIMDHDTYLRPGESIALKKRDVVSAIAGAGRQYSWHSIIIRNSLDRKPDKVGVFDNTVPFNSKGREFIGVLVHNRASSLNHAEDLMFPFSASDYKKVFTAAGSMLGLPNLHPYQTRHGGAAEDLNGAEREYSSVKARGRWMSDSSVRRYTKVGKIQQMLAKLSSGHVEFCRWSLQNMNKVMSGLISPRLP